MTRDGAVSVNLVTGKTTYPSDREPEQNHSASGDTAGAAGKAVDRAELHREQAAAKKKRRKQRRTYREGKAAAGRPSSRLQFSEADQAQPELQGAIRKSDKAADRLDAAKAAVPSKPPSPQHTNPLSRPIQEAGAAIHGKVREVEQENSGVQSGHLGERSFEKAVGYGNRRVQNWRAERKLKPWRDAAKAEQAAVKANADFYYRKAVAENPQLASNPISRLWQKRKLQKQYAAAYRAAVKTAQAGKTAEATAKAAKKTAQESKRTALFLKRHWKGALIVGGIGLLLVMLLGSLQSCSSMFGGGVSNIMASSYLSEDADMLAAEEAYCAKEDELREYLDTYEATHDYDEYHFDLDEIEHDPYVLISILSAIHEGVFTIDQVQGDLQTLFDKQYILTETVTTETRYRTETRTDSEGNPYTVQVPYTWTKKEYEPACVLLERRMLEIGVELESILITLTQVALTESRGDDAEKLACIQEQIAKQFGILECTAYTAKLECAINKKDAECCTRILSLLLASMENSSDISSNPLYKHLNLSDSNMENLPRQLLSSMIEQLKLELDDEASFLKESPEFHSLLQRYGEYLGR